jgi:hypothetical protein
MFEYTYGKRLSNEKLSNYKKMLIETFAQEYDIKSGIADYD